MYSHLRLGYFFVILTFAIATRVLSESITHTLTIHAQSVHGVTVNNGLNNSDAFNLLERVSKLEEKFKKHEEVSHINKSIDVLVQMLLNHYNSIAPHITTYPPLTISEPTLNEISISSNIELGQFAEAEKQLNLCDINDIPQKVRELYASRENNTRLLINFANGLFNRNLSFIILKSLYSEMQLNNHLDPMNLILLAQALNTNLMGQHTDPYHIKDETITTFKYVVDTVSNKTIDFLVQAMKSDQYQTDPKVELLTEAIYDFRPEVSDDVMKRLVDETFKYIEPEKILSNLVSHNRKQVSISGISALFWKIKNSGGINQSIVLDLADELSKLQRNPAFGSLTQQKKDDFRKLLDNIPGCARVIFFQSSVCIFNVEKQSYLNASERVFDSDRRNTSTASNISTGSRWAVEKIGSNILLKSKIYTIEYLYAAIYEIQIYDNRRPVFTYIPGSIGVDPQGLWSVELQYDRCFLRNSKLNEYLFLFADTTNNSTSAFTQKYDPGREGEFLWEFRAC